VRSDFRQLALKRRFKIVNGATPASGNPDFWDGNIVWVTPADLGELRAREIAGSSRHITEAGYASCGTSLAPPGSLVLSTRAPIGALGIATVPICTNQGCKTLVPIADDDPRFLHYVLQSRVSELQALGSGSTFMELSADSLGALSLQLPERDKQRQMADFLDRETAKVDTLIAEKERLLALLAERRQALITQAVTKGLDPSAPMKDSGLPWLGQFPAHWSIRQLRYCCVSIQTGGTPSPEHLDHDDDGGLDWFTPGDFGETLELLKSSRRVSPGAAHSAELQQFPAGAVLVVGIGATLGKVGLLKEAAFANQQVNALIPSQDIDSLFLAYQMTTLSGLVLASANTATLPILNQQRMAELPTVVPPLAEQCAITDHIDRESAKLDAHRAATKRSIALLRERRTALISQAVTGPIDPPEVEAVSAGSVQITPREQ
jgi:type I restriction enzyme, S subunit